MSLEDIKAYARPYYGKEGFIKFFEEYLALSDDRNDMVAKHDVYDACAKFCILGKHGPVPSLNNIGLHLAKLVTTRRRGVIKHQRYCFCGLKFIKNFGTYTTLHPAKRGRPNKPETKKPPPKPKKKYEDDGKEDWEVKDWFRYGDGCLAKKKNKKKMLEKQKLRTEGLETGCSLPFIHIRMKRSGGEDESSYSDSAAYLLSNESSAGVEHSKDGEKDLDEDSVSLVASSRGLQ